MNKYRFLDEKKEHVHQLNVGGEWKNLYGTTTILDVLGKSGLQWWSSGMAVAQFGWLNPKKHTQEERYDAAAIGLERMHSMAHPGEYQEFLDKAYRAHHDLKEKKADEGTDLHSELESWVKSQIDGIDDMFPPSDKIMPFIEWASKNVKRFLFSEIHCYSERLWVGGKTDFGYIDFQDQLILADFKSSKDHYFSNMAQLGGYHIQLEENGGLDSAGNKVIDIKDIRGHGVFYFGAKGFEPAISYNVERNKRMFESCLSLYKDRESWCAEFGRKV